MDLISCLKLNCGKQFVKHNLQCVAVVANILATRVEFLLNSIQYLRLLKSETPVKENFKHK